MTHDDFDMNRDVELGRALRAALDDPAGSDAFVASVLAGYHVPRPLVRDALAVWSRWGVMAAAVVAIAAVLAIQSINAADASMDDALLGGSDDAATALLSDETSPGTDVLYLNTEDVP
jgi:hypothetical protein